MVRMLPLLRTLGLGVALLGAASGCSSGIREAIVTTRNHQGDVAMDNGNFADAALAYRLALQLAPTDEHARAGLSDVQLRIADQLYQNSKFDEALAALAIAAKYDPQSVRLAALRSEVDDARLKREIVVSNYPTYRETGIGLRRSYSQLKTQSAEVLAALQRFDYTYDAAQLGKAIHASYELNQEVGRLTGRLITFRQLVESGSPAKAADVPFAPAASLLPLP
jgi:tetratricopeptide (TPR) repeat protein